MANQKFGFRETVNELRELGTSKEILLELNPSAAKAGNIDHSLKVANIFFDAAQILFLDIRCAHIRSSSPPQRKVC